VRVAGDRFRGLRCIHTHLRGEELTRDDLTDLALLRLDLNGGNQRRRRNGLPGLFVPRICFPRRLMTLRRMVRQEFRFSRSAVASQLDVDFLALIEALESEMARQRRPAHRATNADRSFW
jgi:GTP-binding protein HflX